MEEKFGLHKEPEVESAVKRYEKRSKEKVPNIPSARIEKYLSRLEEIFDTKDEAKRERRINWLKNKLYDNFVIKLENIPATYFDLQKKIDRERGKEPRSEKSLAKTVVADQKSSMNQWIDYLGSKDAMYPNYLKYFAFRGVLELGKYDKERKKFLKRSKDTANPFIELNREALAKVLDALQKQKENLGLVEGSETFKKLLNGANFGKLYAQAIIESHQDMSTESKEITDGKWIKYDQGDNYKPLWQSLQGMGTGWCTAGEITAKNQLRDGDFYVYYTKNKHGEYIYPRIAIRMEDGEISEVRGVADNNQNLEGNMLEFAEKKVNSLPGAEKYRQRTADMKRMMEIEKKWKDSEELTLDDLRFLYEIDRPIEGFGYDKDPRIEEIKLTRDQKGDLSLILNISPDKISLTSEEALQGGMKFHYGTLDLEDFTTLENVVLPEIVMGDLDLFYLKSAFGIKFPHKVGGWVNLNNLLNADGFVLPENVDGGVVFACLESGENLVLPQKIGGNLMLGCIDSVDGLVMPLEVDGYIELTQIKSSDQDKLTRKYPQFRYTYQGKEI